MNNRGKLIVISGPSGVGKTTICNEIIARRKDTVYSISATSRRKRKGEKNGREYFFLGEKEFKKWVKQGKFAEYAIVHGNYYGTPKQFLEEHLGKGNNVLMDIDVQGAKQLMPLYPDGIYIFIMPPDFKELQRRLLKRNTNNKKDIESRLETARKEMEYLNDYRFVVKNVLLEDTINKILEIIGQETKN